MRSKMEEKDSKKIIIINLIIIIVLIILIRILKGPFNINTIHNNLGYDISINDSKIDRYNVEEEYNKAIIPYFVYYSNKTINEYNLHTNTYFAKSDKYILNFKLYTCSKNSKVVSCLSDYDDKQEINYKANEYSIEIKYKEDNGYVYKGELKKDLTKYLVKNGDYHIIIKGNTNNIFTKIKFVVNVFN